MIQRIEKQPITENSFPFTSAKINADLEGHGYLEEEFFFSGTANVYGKDKDNRLSVLVPDAPYTNRFLVRRPKDTAKPSGRVVIEILNTTSFIDIDRSWVLYGEQVMRCGDTYIGLTSKPVTMKTLRKFDSKRYAPLNWDNPRKCRLPQGTFGNCYGSSSGTATEDGLFWDMLTDLSELCRKPNDFLGGMDVKYVYLTGWSQSGGYMVSYVNYFARDRYEKGLPRLFDGYYSMDPANNFAPALNQEEMVRKDLGEYSTLFTDAPYYTVTTQSLFEICGQDVHTPDSLTETLRYIVADIAGATHDNVYSMDTYLKDRTDEFATSMYLPYTGYEPYPNDFPYQLAYRAGLMHLYDWAERGILPPKTDRICTDENGQFVTDEDGNVTGGWRLPEIEFPVCTYVSHGEPLKPAFSTLTYGCEIPFAAEVLKERYGSLEKYEALVWKSAAKAVSERLLMPQDEAYCVRHAVEKAKKYGL